MLPDTAFLEHFVQFVMMGTLILGSQALARRAQGKKTLSETKRVRAILRVSLGALHELYRENLRLLELGDCPLHSGRNQIALLRIQFGRLATLNECEIEALLLSSVAMEQVETAMALNSKPVGAAGFLLQHKEDYNVGDAIETLLQSACASLQVAQSTVEAELAEDAVTKVRFPSFSAGRSQNEPTLRIPAVRSPAALT